MKVIPRETSISWQFLHDSTSELQSWEQQAVGEGGYPEAELERREGRGWDTSLTPGTWAHRPGYHPRRFGGQEDAAHPFIRPVLSAYLGQML